jgi:hypothetical protein
MIFRATVLGAISACLLCASGQTFSPHLGSQGPVEPSQALLNALKAATSPNALGVSSPDLASRLTLNLTSAANPRVLASVSKPATHCAIPLTPALVKSTHDVMSRPDIPFQSGDKAIALPPPAPACPAK